ncbi:integrase core domain-containing protein [Pulveribacter sp.]|uniref:integrase core domain-containing protein n=1 Tax=Pulveribacter sp. TaxID=2678893 RepID=UPI0028B02528|nr:integrase core domain-containing protein [Pulveribacter sp.]
MYRLYKQANLPVRKRPSKQRLKLGRMPLQERQAVGEIWSMDFVNESLNSGRRNLSVCPSPTTSETSAWTSRSTNGIGGEYIVHVFDQIARSRDYSKTVAIDQLREFTSRCFTTQDHATSLRHTLKQPGRPTQNVCTVSFNRMFRDECFNDHRFQSLK